MEAFIILVQIVQLISGTVIIAVGAVFLFWLGSEKRSISTNGTEEDNWEDGDY